jgi:hypothetical protein
MKRTLLSVLALIAVGCADAEKSETASDGSEQVTPSASCAALPVESPLEDFLLCAEQGNASAQLNLGLMYEMGEGVPEDFVEAVRWWRLAAEQGHASAQYNLGYMYDTGEDVPQDFVEAVRWYRLAAEQGAASAQYTIGLMYANGEGVPEDHVLAYMWYNLAAAQGHESAQNNKDIAESRMTREQIAEAQRLSREWLEAHPGGN